MGKLLPAQLSKIAPKGKGVIQNSVTGIGTAALLQTVDNFIGSPLQRFGFVMPFLGIRISAVDLINYMIHAGGLKIKKNAIIAVGASKAVQGSLSLGGVGSAFGLNVSGSPTSTSGPSGGGL